MSACQPPQNKTPLDDGSTNSGGTGGGTGGSTPTTPTPSNPVPNNPAPSTGTLEAAILSAPSLIAGQSSQADIIVSAFFGEVKYTVLSIPDGMSARPLPPKEAPNAAGAALLSIELSGQPSNPSASQVMIVNVTALGKSATLNIPLYRFARTELPSDYFALQLLPLAPQDWLIQAQSGNFKYCCQVYRSQGGKLTQLELPLEGSLPKYEYLKWLTTSAERLWAVSQSNYGSFLLSYPRNFSDLKTPLSKVPLADISINEVVNMGDKLWYMPYNKPNLVDIDTKTGQITRRTLPQFYHHLSAGADGKLYGFAPASTDGKASIVQIDPSTLQIKRFPLTVTTSQPDIITLKAAPDGQLWYIEARLFGLWKFNPQTGQHQAVALPRGAQPSQLAIGAGGQLWVADSPNRRLYSLQGGQVVGVAAAADRAIHALGVDEAGKVWYSQAGLLMGQQ